MKIVGSHTGCYEFIVRLPTGLKFKLGKNPKSDLDIIITKEELKNKDLFLGTFEKEAPQKFDIFIDEQPYGPYIENGELFIPNSYNYLLFSICRKAQIYLRTFDLVKSYGKPVEIFSYEGRKITEIILHKSSLDLPYLKDLEKIKKSLNW